MVGHHKLTLHIDKIIHSAKGIIHGDIKPANVLVFDDKSGKNIAKVIDFGYSTWLGENDTSILMPHTPYWTAPEWHHRPIECASAVRMDIYSFGLVCLWLLFYNIERPEHRNFYEDLEKREALSLAHELMNQIADTKQEEKTSLRHLFRLSLATDPADRCSSLRQLVYHLVPER